MYNETYQEYIRSILGYPTTKNFENTYNYSYMQNDNIDIEKYYPEIYKLINPMICKKCNENNLPITKELIENMTNDIYFAIESDNQININITLQNNLKQTNSIGKPIIKQTNNEEKESSNQRVIKNPTLRDLIKILIINAIIITLYLLEKNYEQIDLKSHLYILISHIKIIFQIYMKI